VAWDTRSGKPVVYDSRREVTPVDAEGYAMAGAFDVVFGGEQVRCRPAFALLHDSLAQFPVARVAHITGMPEDALIAAAQMISDARNVSYHAWTGVVQHTNATQTERAIAVLYALTGSFDAPGGNVPLARQPINRPNPPTLLDPVQAAKALGLDRYPLGPPSQGWVTIDDVYTAILEGRPYPVKVMFGFGSNILVSLANTDRGREALAALDFHVHCDLFETPTSRYADILLPVNSAWEREGLRVGFEISAEAEELVQLRPQMIPAQGESRSDLDIVFALATRLGMSDAFFGGNIEAGWDHMLAPLGITTAQLRAKPEGIRCPVSQTYRKYAQPLPEGSVRGFSTPTRRVEIYSARLLAHGYPALPQYIESDDAVAGAGEFPYVLTTARSGYYCHSQHRGLSTLRKRAQEPSVEIAATLAAELGIQTGDWIAVQTRAGRARFRAKPSDSLQRDVLVAEYGWWDACEDVAMPGYDPFSSVGSNFNRLIPVDHVDPISGAVPMRSTRCNIVVSAQAREGWQGNAPLRVAALTAEADDIVSMVLEPLALSPLPSFQPGQHLMLTVDGDAGAPSVSRAYSLSGAAGTADYRVGIKHVAPRGEAPGAMSTYVHRSLQVGDLIHAAVPAGNFRIPTSAAFPVVLIATGIGITPFLGYLETLAASHRDAMPEVVLLYGSRNRRSHAYADRLHSLCSVLPRLRIHHFLSRPDDVDAPAWSHRQGRVCAAAIEDFLIHRRARFYLCGQEAMLDAMVAGLLARGVPRFEIFLERFYAPVSARPMTTGEFTIRFARSGRSLQWTPAAGNLLSLAEAHGIALPSGCRTGQCESCAIRRLSGEFAYSVATEMEDPDLCLTCQAVPVSDLVLDA
jgi:ferredoxin-NADP reductase